MRVCSKLLLKALTRIRNQDSFGLECSVRESLLLEVGDGLVCVRLLAEGLEGGVDIAKALPCTR